jgi:hypothetical protein
VGLVREGRVDVKNGDAYIERPSSPDDDEKCRLQPSRLQMVRQVNTTLTLCVTDSAFHFSNSVLKNSSAWAIGREIHARPS